MIRTEYPYNENKNSIRTYSDDNMKIKQLETGNIYDEAIDVYPCGYTYVETNELIEEEQNDVI